MTELPNSFYEEEVKCGYLVTKQMKKVWAVELDLLDKFSSVCEKHGLQYFMDGGTLLGAVRHKGFIPWDDDVDVIMPRDDYNKLFKIAEKEFCDPYFFQSTMTEDGFFRTHAQLRNSNTTGFIPIDKNKNVNKGIFLDIFVLDGVADSLFLRALHKNEILVKKKRLAYRYDRTYSRLDSKRKLMFIISRAFFLIVPFKSFFNYFNLRVLARYSKRETKLVGDLTLKWRENVHWPRMWYSGYYYLPFENLMLRAPLFYNDVLKKQYGNYMTIPSNVSAANGRVHEKVTFEPDTPYKEYFANLEY